MMTLNELYERFRNVQPLWRKDSLTPEEFYRSVASIEETLGNEGYENDEYEEYPATFFGGLFNTQEFLFLIENIDWTTFE